MRAFAATTLALLVTLAASGLAAAQEGICGTPAEILGVLNRDYREEPVWTGRSGGDEVIVMANPDGSTWSVVTIEPSGMACMRAAGEGWQAGGPLVEGEDT